MKYLSLLGLLILLLLGYIRPVTAFTQDLGRHLLTGELILKLHHVPTTNLYSYTYPDFPFLNHHWGSEVVFAFLYHLAGMPGLFMLMLMLITIAFGVQLIMAMKLARPLALALVGVLSLHVLFERTDLRPELFSFALLSLFIALLFAFREKPTKLVFLLVPLQLLWVNLHIYFAVGLLTIGLFFLDSLITHRQKLLPVSVKAWVQLPAVTWLGLLLLLTLLVSLVNPHGIAGLLYPLRVFQNYGYTIEENQSVFLLQTLGFSKSSFPPFLCSIALLYLCLLLQYKKTRPVDWLLSLVFSYLAFSAVRNFPLFAIATFIPFTRSLNGVLATLPPIAALKPYRVYLTPLILGSLFVWQVFTITGDHPVSYGVTPGAEKAVDFLMQQHIRGRLFNNFDIGSYLIYRLYPEQQVFVDGRPEAYPADFFQNVYIPMQQDPAGFTQATEHYGFTTIFFSHTDQTPWGEAFLKQIVNNTSWTIIYLDDYAIILVKNIPGNASLISRYGMKPGKLHITQAEDSYDGNIRLASFLTKVGWTDKAVPYLEAILQEKPAFCQALGVLAQIYQEKNNPTALIYAQRYNQSCL
jgi:hypothetical protein